MGPTAIEDNPVLPDGRVGRQHHCDGDLGGCQQIDRWQLRRLLLLLGVQWSAADTKQERIIVVRCPDQRHSITCKLRHNTRFHCHTAKRGALRLICIEMQIDENEGAPSNMQLR